MKLMILKMLPVIGFDNELDAQIREDLLPNALARLHQDLVMPNLVTRDYKDEVKELGDTISVTLPVDLGDAKQFDPETGSESTDIKQGKVSMNLDHWLYQEFALRDDERTAAVESGTLPDSMTAAIESVARGINKVCFDLYKGVYNVSGSASTAKRVHDDVVAARKALNLSKAPKGDRSLVVGAQTEGDLISVYSNAGQAQDNDALARGQIAMRAGFNILSDVDAPEHEAGSISEDDTVQVATEAVAGATTLAFKGATGDATVVDGDIFRIAGVPGTYVVNADSAADGDGDGEITFSPALKGTAAANAAITFEGDHVIDLGLQKGAIMLAFRPLVKPDNSQGATVGTIVDPRTGVTLRMLTWYDAKFRKTKWAVETLFAAKLVRPEFAVRMLKANT